jgi:hypothetical protein
VSKLLLLKLIPPPAFDLELQMVFIRFITETNYILDSFNYAEQYRVKRKDEIAPLFKDLNYGEFIQKHGESMYREFTTNEIFHRYLLIHAFFLMMYSRFEKNLIDITELFRVEKYPLEKSIRWQDGIDGNRKFLYEHGIKKADGSGNRWQTIGFYQKVRNAIVHRGGGVFTGKELNDTTFIKFLAKYNISSKPKDQILIIHLDFLRNFDALVKVFMANIAHEIAPFPKPPIQ